MVKKPLIFFFEEDRGGKISNHCSDIICHNKLNNMDSLAVMTFELNTFDVETSLNISPIISTGGDEKYYQTML